MLSTKVTKNIPFYIWYYHSKSYCLQKVLRNSCCLDSITSYACVTHIRPSLPKITSHILESSTVWKRSRRFGERSGIVRTHTLHWKKSFVNVPLSGCSVVVKPIEWWNCCQFCLKTCFGLQEERHCFRVFWSTEQGTMKDVWIFISYCIACEAFALIIY